MPTKVRDKDKDTDVFRDLLREALGLEPIAYKNYYSNKTAKMPMSGIVWMCSLEVESNGMTQKKGSDTPS